MESRDVTLQKREAIALITISREKVRNALRRLTWDGLKQAFQEIRKDESIRCVVLTGAGSSFSAGEDLKEIAELLSEGIDHQSIREQIRAIQQITKDLLELPIPVIAAVNGDAIGAGAELAIAADIRYASEKSSFQFAEVKVGSFETNGVTYLLPRIIGLGNAKEIMFTGRKVEALEALELGLVNRVVPHEKLLDNAISAACTIASNAPISIRFLKSCLNRSGEISLDDALIYETDAVITCTYTRDAREGALAFVEKRKPNFEGK